MLQSNDPNMLETAFHNGEDYMRNKILAMMAEEKGKALGLVRATIDDLMEVIRRM